MHVVDHEEALGRGADLARQVEGGGHAAGRRDLQRRMRADDHRIAAARLDHAGLHALGAGDGHRLAAATEPVKATAWVRSEAISACAVAAPPGRHDTSPSGSERNIFM